MIKAFTALRRKEGVSQDAFATYWTERHAALVLEVVPPDIAPLWWIFDQPLSLRGSPSPVGGVEIAAFADRSAWTRFAEWADSENARALVEDRGRFADLAATQTVAMDEHLVRGHDVLVSGGVRAAVPELFKVVALLYRRPGTSVREFGRYWLEEHAALAARLVPPGTWGLTYVQNHALPDAAEPAFDGVAEMHFAGFEGVRRWSSWLFGEGGSELCEDEHNFMLPERRVTMIAHEHLVEP